MFARSKIRCQPSFGSTRCPLVFRPGINFERFVRATVNLDVDVLYKPFLQLLPPKARILDAGCGAGRDLKAFAEAGYVVLVMDASPQMVATAATFRQQKVIQKRFQEIAWVEEFDGIWACASLLHVPKVGNA